MEGALPQQNKKRVLVVDDNQDAAEVLSVFLAMEGHDVRLAFDGLAALKRLEGFDAEVVVLDLNMPRMDGYEAGRMIRKRRPSPFLIALSADVSEAAVRRTSALGFDAHLAKPADADDVLRLLQTAQAR